MTLCHILPERRGCVNMIIRYGLLAKIRWSACMSKSHRSLCVSFSRTGAGLCIYHLLGVVKLRFLAHIIIIIIIIKILSLRGCKPSYVAKTLRSALMILVVLWSICLRVSSTIRIAISFICHNFFVALAMSKYSSMFSFFFFFISFPNFFLLINN